VLPGHFQSYGSLPNQSEKTTAKAQRRGSIPRAPRSRHGADLTRVLFALKSRTTQLFGRRLCYVCMGFVSCGRTALSQQRTEHGFYFPVDSKFSHQGLQENLRETVAECTADSRAFHLGSTFWPMQALRFIRYPGALWPVTAANTGLRMLPHFWSGTDRQAGPIFSLYMGTSELLRKQGMSVTAGESIGVVGHSPRLPHLHFAVFVSGEDAFRALADWNLSRCSRWPDGVQYVDTFQWLGSLKVADEAPNRCDLNGDGVVDVKDYDLAQQMALKLIPCTADLNMDGECNVIDVQRVVNASLTGVCRVGP
jgi:hypothetical protein